MMRRLSAITLFLVAMPLLALWPHKAFADCTSPAGVESQTIYDFTGHALKVCTGTSWVSLGGSGGGGGNTMISGWPDAIQCTVTNPNIGTKVFYALLLPNTSNNLYYYQSDGTYVIFNSDQTFNQFGGLTTVTDCGASYPISALYTAGRAYNFIGGATASAAGSAGQVQFYSGGNLAADAGLTWDNTNKRLGIGTASPGQKLDVVGSIKANAGFFDGSAASPGGTGFYMAFGGSSPAAGPAVRWSNGTNANTIGLYVNGGLNFQGGSGNNYFNIRQTTTDGTLGNVASRFSGDSTTSYINALGGNVGIGTANPAEKLEVAGTIQGTNLNLPSLNGANAAGAGYYLCWDSVHVLWGSSCTFSDRRLKTNIQPLGSSLAKILSLQPVRFDWKDPEHAKNDGPQIGLIAQDVEKVFPEVVSGKGDELRSLSYANIVAPLIGAVQELKADNDNQDAKIRELREEIKALKAAIH